MHRAQKARLDLALGLQSSNKHLDLEVDPSITVGDLKKMVSEMEGIPEDETLHFIYQGTGPKNTDTLASCGVKAGTTPDRCLLIWENSEKALAKAAKK